MLELNVQPNKTSGIRSLVSGFRSGLAQIADIILEDPNVNEIHATSWIIAKNPRILEMLGFRVSDWEHTDTIKVGP